MERSLSNKAGLFVILLFAISPFVGYASYTIIDKDEGPFLLMFSIAAIGFLLYEKWNLRMATHTIFFLFFCIFTIFSDLYLTGAQGNVNYFLNNEMLGSLLMLIVIDNIYCTNRFYRLSFNISVLVILIAIVVIIIQQTINPRLMMPESEWFRFSNYEIEDDRLPSIYGYLGGMHLLGICFFPVLIIIIEDFILREKSVLYLIFFFMAGIVVSFLNKSRFMMVNAAMLFLLIPIHFGFNIGKLVRYLVIGFLGLFLLYHGSKYFGYDADQIIEERILEKESGGIMAGNAGSRIYAFTVFKELFPDNPVLGKGRLHSTKIEESRDRDLVRLISGITSQIHVGYLSLFYYYGLIGGGLYVLFLVFLTRKLIRDARVTGRWGPLIGWSMFMVSNLVIVSLDIFIMGVALVLVFNNYYLQQQEEELETV
ncbi:MAG: hypothetical protein JW801_14165 [Bacteroidales bacterium]|nr:hypothetical protein [Bacteroidales bacterium]